MTLLQHKEQNANSLTFPNPVRVGDLLLLFCNANGGTASATDTVGTTYSVIFNHVFSSTDQLVLLAGLAGGSGANTVTHNLGLGGATGIAEFCGAGTTLDGTVVQAQATNAVSITTTVTPDLVIACLGAFHQNNYSVNAPFTVIANSTSSYIAWGYIPDAAIGTFTETFTAGTTPVDCFAVAFKNTGGATCPSGFIVIPILGIDTLSGLCG